MAASRRHDGMTVGVTVLTVTLTVLLAGCSRGNERKGDVAPRRTCGGAETVASSSRPGKGDVSGDGLSDTVVVSYRPQTLSDDPRCLYTLDVMVSGRVIVVPLRDHRIEFRSWETSDRPGVVGLADVSKRAGLEIIVKVGSSASRDYVVLYSLRGRELRRLKPPDGNERYPDSFSYGSSLGSGQSGVGCAVRPGSGVIVRTRLGPTAVRGEKKLERFYYRLDGWALRFERSVTRRLSDQQLERLERPELGSNDSFPGGLAPFPNCLRTVVQ